MFLLIWRGFGVLVPLYVVVAVFLSTMLDDLLKTQLALQDSVRLAVSFAMVGVLAGSALFVTAAKIESKPARILIDPTNNREIKFKSSAGSFFFVPTRYWAYIVGIIGLVAAGAKVAGINF